MHKVSQEKHRRGGLMRVSEGPRTIGQLIGDTFDEKLRAIAPEELAPNRLHRLHGEGSPGTEQGGGEHR